MKSFSKAAIAGLVIAAAGALGVSDAYAKCSPIAASGKGRDPAYVYFDTGKSALRADAKKTIAEQAKLAKDNYIQTICLTGTADKKGDPKANARLSQARANAVAAEFARNGFARKSIETQWEGEPGGSFLGGAGGAQADRRVEIRFTR